MKYPQTAHFCRFAAINFYKKSRRSMPSIMLRRDFADV
jgi:hypothetical protein